MRLKRRADACAKIAKRQRRKVRCWRRLHLSEGFLAFAQDVSLNPQEIGFNSGCAADAP